MRQQENSNSDKNTLQRVNYYAMDSPLTVLLIYLKLNTKHKTTFQ